MQSGTQTSMMAPVYMGTYDSGNSKSKKKEKKKAKGDRPQYDSEVGKLLKAMGIEREDEDFMLYTPMAMNPYGMKSLPGKGYGSNAPVGLPIITPQSMNRAYNPAQQMMNPMQNYIPAQSMQGQMPGQGQGNSMININYVAPDGTAYSMSMSSTQQNRGQGLQNMLCGLYGLMMAEDKGYNSAGKGQAYNAPGYKAGYGGRSGKSGASYAGGGKAGSSGRGGSGSSGSGSSGGGSGGK